MVGNVTKRVEKGGINTKQEESKGGEIGETGMTTI